MLKPTFKLDRYKLAVTRMQAYTLEIERAERTRRLFLLRLAIRTARRAR